MEMEIMMINFNRKKNKQILSIVIIVVVLAMIVPMIISFLI